MSEDSEVRDDDARRLFQWIIERFERSGNVIGRHKGEGWGAIEYAALRSGEVGGRPPSLGDRERQQPDVQPLAVAWGRDVKWETAYR